ncbi:GyrI-like domain-containing protein [Maribacter sp. 2307UL18-2]|uniref:GyrI-like domain-containing protein n=1 Tax=Maribacter sp. 2307UL18-2 TaxID=3386274 RepID=UPI0039BCFD4F
MKTVAQEGFKVIGILIRTTNENGQSAQDIPKLWERFMTEDTKAQIPNTVDSEVLCIYTNYEEDHTKPYDTLLGCRVASLDNIPVGMVGRTFEPSQYAQSMAKGNLTQGIVYQSWVDIWNQDLDRTFRADFEVYGEKAQDPTHAEVDIFVGIK